jgi:uncharacterized repeat protein (TIGR03803 family)
VSAGRHSLWSGVAGHPNGNGNIFKIGTNGSGFAVLHTFTATSGPNLTNIDGAQPRAGLLVSGQALYGAAESGGGFGLGTLFKMDIDGSSFVTLHTFTNHDGAQPLGDLVLSGDELYGTTASGGRFSQGSVFGIRTNGAAFTNLYSFPAASGSPATNSDGASPHAGLILSGNLLYGTAFRGGNASNGTVFGVSTNGTTFTNLHTFTAGFGPAFTNNDGVNPQSELVLSGGTLYGTAFSGGDFGNGTVFSVATNGTSFTTLYQFTATTGDDGINTDGANPSAGLVMYGNSLYGPAANGGTAGNGAIFGLALPLANPQLTISRGGTGVILTWAPTAGFSLQSAPDLASTFTNLPGATSPLTNTLGNPQQFFRLKGN